MNDHMQISDPATDDPVDPALGEALGRAIGRRAEAVPPVSPPSVGDIIDLAASRARARTARRAVVGVAASAVLAVGGALAWDGLTGGEAGTVLTTSEDPSAPGTGSSVAAAATDGGTGSVNVDGIDGKGAVGGSVGVYLGGPADPEMPGPEEFSTGATLEWIEVAPGLVDLFGLESVGDGRVVAFAWRDIDPSENVEVVEQVLVTSNGVDWTEVPLPGGFVPWHIDIAGDRWVAAGQAAVSETPGPGDSADHVFFSDDQGATWTQLDLEIDPPPDPTPASPWLVERPRVTSALVSGHDIVVVVESRAALDMGAMLQDRALLPTGKAVWSWSWSGTGLDGPSAVTVELVDSASAEGALAGGFPDVEKNLELTVDLELTVEELGLTGDGLAALNRSSVRILHSDGSAAALVAEYEGYDATGAATADGFMLTVVGLTDTVITSSDGVVWSEEPALAPGSGYQGEAVAAGSTVWRTLTQNLGSFSVQRSLIGQAPTTVATFEGLQPAGGLAAGPAGVAATVAVARQPAAGAAGVSDGLLPDGRVVRDGYELRLNEPEGGMTLWNLAEDAAVYVLRAGDTPPEGVREVGDSDTLVFEDPDTGTVLVTFTSEDLASVLEAGIPDAGFDAGFLAEVPELWVGWSVDGVDWGWQAMDDAFGIADGEPWTELAVGQDFVLARVATVQYQPAASDGADGASAGLSRSEDSNGPRWFIARVP